MCIRDSPWSVELAHQDVADRNILTGRVRYYGDDIAAVVAEDEITAQRALLSLIHICCSEGACGACTVIIDGKTCKACVPDTDLLDGRTVITVEGPVSYTHLDVYKRQAYLQLLRKRLKH